MLRAHPRQALRCAIEQDQWFAALHGIGYGHLRPSRQLQLQLAWRLHHLRYLRQYGDAADDGYVYLGGEPGRQ